jgi:hypothetical protein
MAKRPRNTPGRPEPLGAILERAGENRFARTRDAIPPALWRDAVGARIAERARPIELQDGVLLLRVPTSVWANELSMLADDVCGRLRERGIEARELRFRVGAMPPIDRPPQRRIARAVPVVREVPAELARVLEGVTDPALRSAIENAAAANLAWQTVTRPAPPARLTEAQRAARAPRSSEEETVRRAPASPASPAGRSGKRADGPGRSR